MNESFIAVESALKQVSSAIQSYLDGNRTEISKLENAIEDIDRALVPVISREAPEKLIEYLTQKVELTLKIEELKVQKGVSISTLVKGWAPVLAPFLAAMLAFAGVLVGAMIQTKIATQKHFADSDRREKDLVMSIVSTNSTNEASLKIESLLDSGLLTKIDGELVKALAEKLKKPVVTTAKGIDGATNSP